LGTLTVTVRTSDALRAAREAAEAQHAALTAVAASAASRGAAATAATVLHFANCSRRLKIAEAEAKQRSELAEVADIMRQYLEAEHAEWPR
jgi:hypothetical protein